MNEITSCLAGPAPVVPTPEVESRVASGLERKEAPAAPRGSLCLLPVLLPPQLGSLRTSQSRTGLQGEQGPLAQPRELQDGLGPRGAWGRTCGGLGRIAELERCLHWAGTRSRPSHQPAALLTRSTSLGLGGWTEA